MPTPAVPPMVEIGTVPGGPAGSVSSAVRAASGADRPAKCRTVAGSCRGTNRVCPPGPAAGAVDPATACRPRSARAAASRSSARAASAAPSIRQCAVSHLAGSVSSAGSRTPVCAAYATQAPR
ncbi:hypothetical protein ABZ436_28160 [Micromonospora matsumotoense]|uniref:hypothetical protein n=1 Tax=Micromonospora matsumotoense TaxID=121616 RepID=UPI00340B4F76